MCLACRLDDVYFLPNDTQWLTSTYNDVYMLCQHGPFFIEPKGYLNGLLTIRVLDADERTLNDIVIESKLAVLKFVYLMKGPSFFLRSEYLNISKKTSSNQHRHR